jgi:hypothetical protein
VPRANSAMQGSFFFHPLPCYDAQVEEVDCSIFVDVGLACVSVPICLMLCIEVENLTPNILTHE